MGQAGRQRAISTFSHRAYANAWERLYDGVVGHKDLEPSPI